MPHLSSLPRAAGGGVQRRAQLATPFAMAGELARLANPGSPGERLLPHYYGNTTPRMCGSAGISAPGSARVAATRARTWR
jgi:hypothetical protein